MKTIIDTTFRLSIVMPCLNEAETLEICIRKARKFLSEHQIEGEVIIAENGSTDGSQEIAMRAGARVVHIPAKGYGSALMGGINAVENDFIIMGDADDSYDFTSLQPYPRSCTFYAGLCKFLHQHPQYQAQTNRKMKRPLKFLPRLQDIFFTVLFFAILLPGKSLLF